MKHTTGSAPRWSLSLRARVIVAMFVSGLVMVGVLVAAVLTSVNHVPYLEQWTVPAADLAACEADPARWHKEVFAFAEAWAYDLDGRSRNPSAPLLEPELAHAAIREGTISVGGPGPQHVEVQRVAATGPCALVRVRVGEPPPEMASAAVLGVAIGIACSLLLTVGLATWFVLQPILARIGRIRRTAAALGSTDYTPLTDIVPDALGAIATVLDTSHRRIVSNEAELRERQVALERHLAEIAHDLRTPLASLVLALQDLVPLAGVGSAVGRALDDAEYVNALVDNLHQGTLLRRGLESSDAGVVDLCEIVQRLEARFAALGALRGIEVAASFPEHPVRVAGAPALAERAIANLVHNAVRHGHDGGHVAVILACSDATFALTVVDDGPGLPRDHLASLQATTFRDDPARQRSGGLGLVVTLEVARRLGWSVQFEPGAPGLRVVVTGALQA